MTEAVAQKINYAKPTIAYTIELTKIEGDGDFPCPKCGKKISPDDETEEVYTIIEEKIRNNNLIALIIQCNSCLFKIALTGFPALNDIPDDL